ncbi:MAG: S8 family serine peptidase [Bacteroidia bacterium]|jgi:hypothetical protein|nr:S8 family serine peptidase [Bacteroidia bacterium]
MKRFLLCCIGLVLFVHAQSQYAFVVYLSAKDSSWKQQPASAYLTPAAVERRAQQHIQTDSLDYPLPLFVDSVFASYKILTSSKWFNALVIEGDKKLNETLVTLPYVRKVVPIGSVKSLRKSKQLETININEALTALETKFTPVKKDSNFYGKSLPAVAQLNLATLHQQGWMGQGVKVAVIDAGFPSVAQLPFFKHVFDSMRLLPSYDVAMQDSNVFAHDDHGLAVLSCMATHWPYQYVGTAPLATYQLLRTEYAPAELPIEEWFWIRAVEIADSMGIQLINSSLGYTDYDDQTYSYTLKDLDGKTAPSSIAATIAVQKGIVVVVSAGNEGDNAWKHICIPADADGVITVGAVSKEGYFAPFSSIGPTADKRIKPDVVALGDDAYVASTRGVFYENDGTSFASPVLAGAVVCLMQARPNLLPKQYLNALHLSGSRYAKPDHVYGYGIPDMALAYAFLGTDSLSRIIELRQLKDAKLHLALMLDQDQKVTVSVMNSLQKNVFKAQWYLFKGANRLPLKKIKQLKPGTYTLQVKLTSTVLYHSFTILPSTNEINSLP